MYPTHFPAHPLLTLAVLSVVVWLRYYSYSTVYLDIYSEWQMVALPPLLVSEMSIPTALQSAITCNGTELASNGDVVADSTSSYVDLPVQGPSRVEQSINALGDFYTSISSSYVNFDYSVDTSPNAMNWSQRTGGLSFFYLDEILVPPTEEEAEQFLLLPSFMTGVSLIHNSQLSPTVTLNASFQLVVDFNVLVRIGQSHCTTMRSHTAPTSPAAYQV